MNLRLPVRRGKPIRTRHSLTGIPTKQSGRQVPNRASRLPAVAPPANTINRQEVAERSNRSSNDDERVPVGANPSRRPTGQAQHRPLSLNVGLDLLDLERQP